MSFNREVSKSNNQGRRRISRKSSRRSFSSGADRIHKVNMAITPAMTERGGIRL